MLFEELHRGALRRNEFFIGVPYDCSVKLFCGVLILYHRSLPVVKAERYYNISDSQCQGPNKPVVAGLSEVAVSDSVGEAWRYIVFLTQF